MSGSTPAAGQPLLGVTTNPVTPSAPPAPAANPIGALLGGLDVSSLISNLGGMFLRGMGNNALTHAGPSVTANVQTPRFRPTYADE